MLTFGDLFDNGGHSSAAHEASSTSRTGSVVVTPSAETLFVGIRLIIEWGAGKRAWIQLSQQAKPIIELRREFKEPEFPGYLGVVESLSRVGSIPAMG